MKRTGLALAACVLLHAAAARARTPEIAVDPRDGIWIAQDDKFIFQTLDRWSVFPAGATVNKLIVDQTILWVATDDGVIRFDIGSQKSTKLTMDDGLPSQRVSTVAFDDQYVWFGTNKGLVRYRKFDRTLKTYDESNGLPSKAITYAVTIGRQVWFGTRAGIAVFSPDVDGFRAFGEADGLASGDVAEVFQFESDLWCRTDVGLSRFRIQQRVFNNFAMTVMGASQILAMVPDGQTMWLGTDNGLWQFDDASDAIRIFPQQAALGSKTIVGIEPTPSYIYFTTDKEILQYNKLTQGIRRFTAADQLTRQEGSTGTLSTAKFVTVLFADGAVVYNPTQDMWVDRSLAVTVAGGSKTNARIFGQLELEQPFQDGKRDTSNAYATSVGGMGFGRQLDKDRSLNGSVYLDYGQLNASGIRDLQYKIEYLGNQNDVLRDVRIEDQLKYRYIEEGLDRQLLVQGAHVGLATPGAEPKAKLEVDVGFRRGQLVRDFLTGPWQEIYQLSQKYIMPGSERVYVDGELLNNGTDYTMVYPAGQITFLNRERVDDLSVITVEYERDLMPKKSLGNLSLQARLPASNEIGTWALSGTPAIISTDTALYNQIDGGAPLYIDHGSIASVYATYQQGGSSIQVDIHNMSTPENARGFFDIQLPTSRIEINKIADPSNPSQQIANAVVDMGLATAYKAIAFDQQYYYEVSIDDHSDAALVYLKTFMLLILNRSKMVTANLGDTFKEALVAARAAVSPVQGMEIGVRAVQLEQLSGTSYQTTDASGGKQNVEIPPMHLTSAVVDGRYQTKVGEGGLITGYTELGASHDSNGVRPDGLAGMGFVRLSSEHLEGMVSARMNTENWTPVGHTSPTPDGSGGTSRTYNDARMGTLRDQLQLNATGYPVSWLPVTALFMRQRAWLPDGSEGTGVLQHAIARVQLNKAGWPATTLQLGSTELDNPNAQQMHRVQGSVQTDYDLAQVLSFTHIKRFNVRALYSLSQAETDNNGSYQYGDRVRLIRLEGKFSPTTTESVNALFRSREVDRQTEQEGPYGLGLYHWELTSGAQSTIIPGLVPKLSYNVFYDDCRITDLCAGNTTGTGGGDTSSLWSNVHRMNVGPAGSAVTPASPAMAGSAVTLPGMPGGETLNLPSRNVQGTLGGALGIYPGAWWPKLSPLAFVPSLAVGQNEQTSYDIKTMRKPVYDYVLTEVWAGRTFEASLYQRYRYTNTGPAAEQDSTMTVLQNRMVYRPVFTSPITLLVNYESDRSRDVTYQNPWSETQNHSDMLEWLMRWNQVVTTRTRLKGTLEHTDNTVASDGTPANHSKYGYGGEVQFRFYPLPDVSALFIYVGTEWKQWDQRGDRAFTAWEVIPTWGVIWRMGDKLYLDGHGYYDHVQCLSGAAGTCTNSTRVSPYLYLTMNI